MDKFMHLFALSVYRDRIVLAPDYKAELVRLIYEMEASAARPRRPGIAWLGDTQGLEFLFQHRTFAELFQQIGQKVREYTASLGIDNEQLEFYFQRAWATITRGGERITEHAHMQSNITFAYYLRKPPGSGGINFITHNHPNEIAPGAFSPAKASLGFISRPSLLTWNSVVLDPAEDEIVIFPSKTIHATAPNNTGEPRISLSADIVTMLRASLGHETMMPNISHWRSFDALGGESA